MIPSDSEIRHFKKFVKEFCDGAQTIAAKKLKTYPQAVHKWFHGLAVIPPKIAIQIEKITKGSILRHNVRKDLR